MIICHCIPKEGPTSLVGWHASLQPFLLLLLSIGETPSKPVKEGVAEQATDSPSLSQTAWLLSWPGQPASEEAAPPSPDNQCVATYAPLSCPLPHWVATILKPVLLSSSGLGSLQITRPQYFGLAPPCLYGSASSKLQKCRQNNGRSSVKYGLRAPSKPGSLW